MPITQLHGILFANQNMQVVASKQISLQGRVDFQNIIAAATANDKQKEIDETRATEEGKGINQEREHNKERAQQETSEQEKKSTYNQTATKEEELDSTHILDIKV